MMHVPTHEEELMRVMGEVPKPGDLVVWEGKVRTGFVCVWIGADPNDKSCSWVMFPDKGPVWVSTIFWRVVQRFEECVEVPVDG